MSPNPIQRRETLIKKFGSEKAYLQAQKEQASKGGKQTQARIKALREKNGESYDISKIKE